MELARGRFLQSHHCKIEPYSIALDSFCPIARCIPRYLHCRQPASNSCRIDREPNSSLATLPLKKPPNCSSNTSSLPKPTESRPNTHTSTVTKPSERVLTESNPFLSTPSRQTASHPERFQSPDTGLVEGIFTARSFLGPSSPRDRSLANVGSPAIPP